MLERELNDAQVNALVKIGMMLLYLPGIQQNRITGRVYIHNSGLMLQLNFHVSEIHPDQAAVSLKYFIRV